MHERLVLLQSLPMQSEAVQQVLLSCMVLDQVTSQSPLHRLQHNIQPQIYRNTRGGLWLLITVFKFTALLVSATHRRSGPSSEVQATSGAFYVYYSHWFLCSLTHRL